MGPFRRVVKVLAKHVDRPEHNPGTRTARGDVRLLVRDIQIIIYDNGVLPVSRALMLNFEVLYEYSRATAFGVTVPPLTTMFTSPIIAFDGLPLSTTNT